MIHQLHSGCPKSSADHSASPSVY